MRSENSVLRSWYAIHGTCADGLRERKEPRDTVAPGPVYDVVIFCDLGMEPPWVKDQVEFTRKACEWAGIKFVVLDSPLYSDFMQNFGERRTISIPWWTIREDGHQVENAEELHHRLQGGVDLQVC